MLRINEIFTDADAVTLQLEGRIDTESLMILTRVCESYLTNGESLAIDLKGIDHISKEGREFLKQIKSKVKLNSLSEYLKLEIL